MKNKILFVLCLLVGLLFLNGGLNKFFNYIPVPPDLPEGQVNMFTAMMQVGWLMPLIAVAEIVGGILFIIPRFRPLGAIILFPILIGILLTNLTVAPEGIPLTSIMFAIWTWVIIENFPKYRPMVNS
ncbi:DoxX family membrane protein [Pseudochryseolinea flava]|uniref:DoxX family protein n=1 Tax=Pseudochryseolinea flava TaxID=2059302 RepID=A0A364Y1E4_9BACT|nr:DoxX family membrane protein [Pseudochryseolinea flava]RAW00421.1 DoxX family protein [Pseudochryseolinea flava]